MIFLVVHRITKMGVGGNQLITLPRVIRAIVTINIIAGNKYLMLK
jgi:hypothetical protein